MQVSVESVHLKFPLDLEMGGMLAIQEGDTILNAEELQVNVQMKPLLKGKLNIDNLYLKNADVNTRSLIDAVLVKGHIGELKAKGHDNDFSLETIKVNDIFIKDADVLIAIADTVPPDTTESSPSKLKLDLQNVNFDNVDFSLALAQNKGYSVDDLCKQKSLPTDIDSHFGKATLSAFVDTENSIYDVRNLHVEEGSARVDEAVKMNDISLDIDSLTYKDPKELYLNINRLSGKEQCGINFKDVHGQVLMDSVGIKLPDLSVETDDSKFNIDMDMDFTTWDDVNPGVMQLNIESQIGKSDAMYITRYVDRFLDEGEKLDDARSLINDYMSAKPTPLNISLTGNLQDVKVDNIYTNIDGIGKLEGSLHKRGDDVIADLTGKLNGGNVTASGSYNLNKEEYDVDLDLRDFKVNEYVDLGENTRLTGLVHAKGKGFDFNKASTRVDATAKIKKGNYGKVDLSSTNAIVKLKNQKVDLTANCDNSQLKTDFNFTGSLNKGVIDGDLDIDLPYADIQAMGFSDDKLIVSTSGKMSLYTDLDKVYKIDSHMEGVDLEVGEEKIHTDNFDLFAETDRNSTVAHLKTGDLHCDLDVPCNVFTAIDKYNKMYTVFDRQVRKRDINLDEIRKYMPEANIHATAGKDNPIASILNANGIRYEEFVADFNISPESGVTGNGHLFSMKYDTIRIDTAYFDIKQDSDRIAFLAGVKCDDQPISPAFSARVDGYYNIDQGDAHLQFFNSENEKGVDLGVHLTQQDSVIHMTLYPEEPILAYRKFSINDDNYIDFYKEKNHPIVGNVQLKSTTDDCDISIVALDNEGDQRALLEINNLNLGELCKVLPFVPSLDGMFYIDAAYQEEDDKFYVDGTVQIDDFVYEDMSVGNVGSMFTYEPEGTSVHKIEGDFSYNGVDVATVDGKYDANGEGTLDADLKLHKIPMKMLSPFVSDFLFLDGALTGDMHVQGPTDKLIFNGDIITDSVTVSYPYYAVSLRVEDDTLRVDDSKIYFENMKIFGQGDNPLTLDGTIDFSSFDEMPIDLRLAGRNVKVVEAKRKAGSAVFGDAYGDLFLRVRGTTNDMKIRGGVNILNTTYLTYILDDSEISQGDRLEDIVTFVNFELPPDTTQQYAKGSMMGLDMQFNVNVNEGAHFRVELSADRQSYVDVRGGGELTMISTPETDLNVLGKLTVNEGDLKYANDFIPLKNFTLQSGSYVEFTGPLTNPTLNITAKHRTKAPVSEQGSSTRSVIFDVGLEVTNTLEDMGLLFTINAPEDMNVQEELDDYTDEEKQKLAVALLAVGMYVSDTNSSALTANNALSSFLQSEINNLTGRALGNIVDVSLGVDQQTYANGSTGTDYSFKFSKRFFSDRLSVSIGGRVSDNKEVNQSTGIGSFIDDVSLEWRLDRAGTRYVRIFHGKDYDNLIEGVLEKNGAGIVLKKKFATFYDLIPFLKKKNQVEGIEAVENKQQPTDRKYPDNDGGQVKAANAKTTETESQEEEKEVEDEK